MKKTLTLLIFTISFFANAQYFEGFENGVPGTMTQTYAKGETTFIDFSIAAVGVENALSDTNSAVFANPMATETTITTLQTPVLDLTSEDYVLEFKHLQKSSKKVYNNELAVELSNDFGKTWQTVTIYNKPNNETETEIIDLSLYSSKTTIVRFKATQFHGNYDLPIVIDDISIQKKTQDSNIVANKLLKNEQETSSIYPNPSTGNFYVNTKKNASITVYDANWRNVLELESCSNETSINLTNFPKGFYLVKINNKTTVETKKILLK